MKSMNRTFLIILLTSMTLVALVVFFQKETVLDLVTNKSQAPVVVSKVEGLLVPIQGDASVAGVDLTVGDTTIRTGREGRFVFVDVPSDIGITLTHPSLLRKIVFAGEEFLVSTGLLSIYFDAELYNTLIKAIEYEARRNTQDAYVLLDKSVQEVQAVEHFENTVQRIFHEEDLLDQEVVITRVGQESFISGLTEQRYKQAYSFIVDREGTKATYRFVLRERNGEQIWKRVL